MLRLSSRSTETWRGCWPASDWEPSLPGRGLPGVSTLKGFSKAGRGPYFHQFGGEPTAGPPIAWAPSSKSTPAQSKLLTGLAGAASSCSMHELDLGLCPGRHPCRLRMAWELKEENTIRQSASWLTWLRSPGGWGRRVPSRWANTAGVERLRLSSVVVPNQRSSVTVPEEHPPSS